MILAQAAEAASNGTEWAVIAAFVAAGGAVGSIFATLRVSGSRLKSEERRFTEQLQHEAEESTKRVAHEERMQAQRLEHERVEAIRTTAAKAYSDARSVLVYITPDTVVTMGHEPLDGAEVNVRKLVGEASDALSVVGVMGWDEPVKTSALELREEITNLATSAWKLTKKTREIVRVPHTVVSDLAAYEAFKTEVGEANEKVATAVDAYRKAVAGEDA